MRRTKANFTGFTLIEVMMVVLIFSIMLSFIAINSNFTLNENTKLKNDAQNLMAKIKLAKQEAIFQQATLKLNLNPNSYSFMRLENVNNKHVWQKINHNSVLENTQIDKNMIIEQKNELVFYPDGTFSEFSLLLKNKKGKNYYMISSNDGINIRYSQNDKP